MVLNLGQELQIDLPPLDLAAVEDPQEQMQAVQTRVIYINRKIQEYSKEMAELLEVLIGKKKKAKNPAAVDENNEPTWKYKLKCVIPEKIYLTKKMQAYAYEQGLKPADVVEQWITFVNWYTKKGTKWMHWSKVWADWCRREKQKLRMNGGEVIPLRTSRSLREF